MVNTRLQPVILFFAALLVFGCAAGSPYTYTGAALGGGVGALSGAAIDSRNPWRGAAIGGVLGGVLGGVAGEAVRQSRYPSQPQGYYQPGYGPPPGYGAPPRYGYGAPPQGQGSYGGQGNYSQNLPAPQYSYRKPPVNSYYYYPDSKSGSGSDPNFGSEH